MPALKSVCSLSKTGETVLCSAIKTSEYDFSMRIMSPELCRSARTSSSRAASTSPSAGSARVSVPELSATFELPVTPLVSALPLHPAFRAAWEAPDGELRQFVELTRG